MIIQSASIILKRRMDHKAGIAPEAARLSGMDRPRRKNAKRLARYGSHGCHGDLDRFSKSSRKRLNVIAKFLDRNF